MTEFSLRDAVAEDRDEVLAFTAQTWDFGDYIQWVFDDWVRDGAGRFLVAVDRGTGRIAGIDKLSFFAPGEAWFQGLRVHPDFRGRGLADLMERHMIEEARSRGASTIRFLTVTGNLAVHRNAYRNGFKMRFVARHWEWPGGEIDDPPSKVERDSNEISRGRLRTATPEEAPELYEWWRRSSAWYATGGLVNRDWSFGSSSADEWTERAAEGHLLVPTGTDVSKSTLPPAVALVSKDLEDEARPTLVISVASAGGPEWGDLALGLRAHARERGFARIRGLLPDGALLHSGFRRAGFHPDGDEDCLCLFELAPG
jgi:GNAT superfamily N-acetyltransferase